MAAVTIKWRLAVVLADREMTYLQLAERTGLHRVTVNKLKNRFVAPPRIDSDTLDKLCRALQCQPGDLMVWVPDGEEVKQ